MMRMLPSEFTGDSYSVESQTGENLLAGVRVKSEELCVAVITSGNGTTVLLARAPRALPENESFSGVFK